MGYGPFLVGVDHVQGFELRVIEILSKLNVNTVGVEVSRHELFIEPPVDKSTQNFWRGVVAELEIRGKKVIFLTPDRVEKRIRAEQKRLESARKQHANIALELINPEIRTRYAAMVKHTLTRFLEKGALKEKPDAIVVGAGHADLMRKDMRIPKKKCFFVGFPENKDKRKLRLDQIAGVRRFQSLRKKSRMAQQRKIRAAKKQGG